MKNPNRPPTREEMQEAKITLVKMIEGHFFSPSEKKAAEEIVSLLGNESDDTCEYCGASATAPAKCEFCEEDGI